MTVQPGTPVAPDAPTNWPDVIQTALHYLGAFGFLGLVAYLTLQKIIDPSTLNMMIGGAAGALGWRGLGGGK